MPLRLVARALALVALSLPASTAPLEARGRVGAGRVSLRSLDVYHTPPLPLGTREAPTEHWVRLVGEETTAGLVY